MLDTPVSGSVAIGERGELTGLVGGGQEAIERARSALESRRSRKPWCWPKGGLDGRGHTTGTSSGARSG
jgi:hypothetical protein